MTKTKKSFRAVGPVLFAFAALAGVAIGACGQDEGDDDYEPSAEVKNACEDYCDRAKLCDDERDVDKCNNDCIQAMGNCQVDEQAQAIDQLEICSNSSCDDFFGCSVKVGAQCFFGL